MAFAIHMRIKAESFITTLCAIVICC